MKRVLYIMYCIVLNITQQHHILSISSTPSEPILFPKLRIYFADFPYLHSST